MNISGADLKREVDSIPSKTLEDFYALTAEHGGGVMGVPLLVGFASRETNCINEVGDGGHGRGTFQIDDRYWPSWLHHQPGCRSGSDRIVPGHTALDWGFCPTVKAGALKCILMYVDNFHTARGHGFPKDVSRHIAVAAYNAGLGGALNGQRQYGNPDHYSTGGDYGADVLARASAIYHDLKGRHA